MCKRKINFKKRNAKICKINEKAFLKPSPPEITTVCLIYIPSSSFMGTIKPNSTTLDHIVKAHSSPRIVSLGCLSLSIHVDNLKNIIM